MDLPAFVATVHGTRRHDLFFSKMDACVDDYMLRDAAGRTVMQKTIATWTTVPHRSHLTA